MKIRIAKTENETFGEKIHRISHNAAAEVKEFYQEHKKEIYIGSTILLTATAMGVDITKTVLKHRAARNQDLRIYDRSLDIWWDLRRKLTTDERLAINERVKAGEKLGDILKSLHVLRKR